ncbi:hypothetical protein PsorP6_005024 [Peronosclerospora sorghi]|uniref:Uncharacterized protein n=1 Tax=Peronosclerospora sorghi TaxID=230839 RepID=A0ACC0W5H2_9STRA|nr:hypothetical protein PsorP6_005024 [Peronosclerospora sorghi]
MTPRTAHVTLIRFKITCVWQKGKAKAWHLKSMRTFQGALLVLTSTNIVSSIAHHAVATLSIRRHGTCIARPKCKSEGKVTDACIHRCNSALTNNQRHYRYRKVGGLAQSAHSLHQALR